MAVICRCTLFLATLQRIKERHRNVKAHGKSWQQSCAKSSEKSIQALSEATLRTRRNSLLSSTVLMGAFVTLLLVFLARQEAFQVCSRAERGTEQHLLGEQVLWLPVIS